MTTLTPETTVGELIRAVPDWACNTFRALYDTLAWLERNMHQHVHKENTVLFPRALAKTASPATDKISV